MRDAASREAASVVGLAAYYSGYLVGLAVCFSHAKLRAAAYDAASRETVTRPRRRARPLPRRVARAYRPTSAASGFTLAICGCGGGLSVVRVSRCVISQLRAAPWTEYVWTEDDITDLPLKGVRGAV